VTIELPPSAGSAIERKSLLQVGLVPVLLGPASDMLTASSNVRIGKKLLALSSSRFDPTANRWARGLPYRYRKELEALKTPLRLAGLPE